MYFSFNRSAFFSCLLILLAIQYSQPMGNTGTERSSINSGSSNSRNRGGFAYPTNDRRRQNQQAQGQNQEAQGQNQEAQGQNQRQNPVEPYSGNRYGVRIKNEKGEITVPRLGIPTDEEPPTAAAVPNKNEGTWIRAFLIPDPENTNPPPPMKNKK